MTEGRRGEGVEAAQMDDVIREAVLAGWGSDGHRPSEILKIYQSTVIQNKNETTGLPTIKHGILPVLRIRIGSRFNGFPSLHSDPDLQSGSVSRRVKTPHKNRKKFNKISFFEVLDVLVLGLSMIKKISNFSSAVNFFLLQFLVR